MILFLDFVSKCIVFQYIFITFNMWNIVAQFMKFVYHKFYKDHYPYILINNY
jgi:hypothetical protein